MSRLPVKKTYKLFIGGAFPRSESGRTYEAEGQNVARASRKDVRDAVRAARPAYEKWAAMTAYNRGQVLYRVAEMMEARRSSSPSSAPGRRRSTARSTASSGTPAGRTSSRRCSAVRTRSPARTSTSPCLSRQGSSACSHPTSRRSPGSSRGIAPVVVGGNAVVAVASESRPLAAIELAEVLATSDVPGGVVNILTGYKEELAPWLAGHMDVNAIDVTGADGLVPDLERVAAENVKRVVRGHPDGQSPWQIADFLELKTVWHPIGR